ncbi:MAG TPA: hypothetical protein VFB95_07315 [Candidatus Cryosericum sp.]|nr:hypothetical protein [Candidatus Cryosericum sp.]
MNRFPLPAMVLSIGVLLCPWSTPTAADPPGSPPNERGGRPAPEFPTQDPALWINSPPLSMSGLRGRVVLIDIWTFG